MGEERKAEKVRNNRASKDDSQGRCHPHHYPFEVRLKAVKLYLEEGYSQDLIRKQLGLGRQTLFSWVRRYRELGEEGLRGRFSGTRQPKVSPAVKQKITELKRKNPGFGVKRISEVLRRIFFLRASRETVRRTLHQQSLLPSEKKKLTRSPPKPRFFERSTPNQMWQSDIFTFRLGGKNAYLIGFIDDYSRYMVGVDLFRSQSAEHVLEVYRTAVGEYGVPKEVLTDQGRQYTSWRGKTRFEMELKKDRVHHIKSAAHHPMTLGKIERFWKTIWEDFLCRAQFDSFDSARERVRLWVKHYNHQRPHQGIGGLCPADRFFAIQKELREVIERGIKENLEELALRGEPKEPFYVVGRMGEQSVVIRAEKGKLKMHVEEEGGENRETNYDSKGAMDHGEQSKERAASVHGRAEMPGGLIGLGGETKGQGDLPGAVDPADGIHQVAGAGDGRDATGFGTQRDEGGAKAGAVNEASEASFAQGCPERRQDGEAPPEAPEGAAGKGD